VVAVPGDRADELLRSSAQAAAAVFDDIVIREDEDLRGRDAGETARLLCTEIKSVKPHLRCRFVQEGEVAAMWAALGDASPGDLVVVFYDELEPITRALIEAGARLTASEYFATEWKSPAPREAAPRVEQVVRGDPSLALR
jgi:cyanophycin synthetase